MLYDCRTGGNHAKGLCDHRAVHHHFEPNDIDQRFRILETIGEGTYGMVYKAFDLTLNKVVALKKVKVEHSDEGIPSTALREISLLRELDHVGIIKLLDVLHGADGKKLYLILEFFNIDLKKHLDRTGVPMSV